MLQVRPKHGFYEIVSRCKNDSDATDDIRSSMRLPDRNSAEQRSVVKIQNNLSQGLTWWSRRSCYGDCGDMHQVPRNVKLSSIHHYTVWLAR
jgi:hypothetical protein